MGASENRFGKMVRRLRERQGFSQEAFAYHAQIDRSYQGRIERGEVSVTLQMMQILAGALRIPLHDFLRKLAEEVEPTTL
jgi:transcriptional regulator with XRE-family HTH domain